MSVALILWKRFWRSIPPQKCSSCLAIVKQTCCLRAYACSACCPSHLRQAASGKESTRCLAHRSGPRQQCRRLVSNSDHDLPADVEDASNPRQNTRFWFIVSFFELATG